jgi:hypothetical protein
MIIDFGFAYENYHVTTVAHVWLCNNHTLCHSVSDSVLSLLSMAPRIVSWSDREICISPVLSSAASIVSFDSTLSDLFPSHSQMPPTTSLGLPSDQFGAKHASLPGVSEEGRTPRGAHATLDDSFVRHDTYFFEDGNVTFLVRGPLRLCLCIPDVLTSLQIDDTLYCVHRFFFSRDSTYFSERFAQLGIRDHKALPIVISLGDVERKDFEALLSILYPTYVSSDTCPYLLALRLMRLQEFRGTRAVV